MSYQVVMFTDDMGPGEILGMFTNREDSILFGEAKLNSIRKQWRKLGYLRTEHSERDEDYEILLTDALNNLLAAIYVEEIDVLDD